jgi:hypothetical protein
MFCNSRKFKTDLFKVVDTEGNNTFSLLCQHFSQFAAERDELDKASERDTQSKGEVELKKNLNERRKRLVEEALELMLVSKDYPAIREMVPLEDAFFKKNKKKETAL